MGCSGTDFPSEEMQQAGVSEGESVSAWSFSCRNEGAGSIWKRSRSPAGALLP